MLKKTLLNLLLLFVAAILVIVIYFSEEQNTLLERLTDIDSDAISSIMIRHNNNITTLNKQPDKQWHINQPVLVAANNFRINSILKLLNAPVHNSYSAGEVDLKKLGLLEPKTSIAFDNNLIAFGIINPATKLRYIRLNERIATIEDVYYPLLSSHFGTLVSLNLLPENAGAANGGIEKLILLNQTIAKDEKGLWRSNINYTADDIAKTIDHWQHGQAFGVHEYLPRKQIGEVFIYIKDQQQAISYSITDTDPWLILARPEIGLEYHLDIEAYDKLIAPQ